MMMMIIMIIIMMIIVLYVCADVKMSKNLFNRAHGVVVAGRPRRAARPSRNSTTTCTLVKWWRPTRGPKCRLKEPFRW